MVDRARRRACLRDPDPGPQLLPHPPRQPLVASIGQRPDELDAVVLAGLFDHRPLDRLEWREAALPRREGDRAVELAVAGGREDEIARLVRLDPEAVHGSPGDVGNGASWSEYPRLIADEQRQLTLQDVEGLHVVGVAVKWDALAATGLLVDEAERPLRLLPCGEEAGGVFLEPPPTSASPGR